MRACARLLAAIVLLAGLAPGVKLQARSWRVDRQSGDAFTAWKAMGSPANPSKSQVDRLISASHMAVRRVLVGPMMNDGNVSLETRLPRQGVELIELTPRYPGRD
jgi:xylan 1,4-beta-xylosidase